MTPRQIARTACLGTAALIAALPPVPARANSAAMDYFPSRADRSSVPSLLTADERAYYGKVFAAIDRGEWSEAQALIGQRGDGPLHAVARAQLYLAAGSPRVEAGQLAELVSAAPELPWADQVSRLALKRGASVTAALPGMQALNALPALPRRGRPHATADGTMPDATATAIVERIKADDPDGAAALLGGADPGLSPPARAEWRQKVGWSYYIENRDADARRVSLSAADGSGPWVAEALWTAGLAAWRGGDAPGAADSFEKAGLAADSAELAAAAQYWAARAWLRAHRPERVSAQLRAAVRHGDTLYGLLAGEALGLHAPQAPTPPDFSGEDWQKLRALGNVRAAVALAQIGEDGLADEMLRHQARIGEPGQYAPLTRLARDLGLPATQLWMATNAPAGARPDDAARFPAPRWVPANGWKVDPALLFAHSLQESNFRTAAVSGAGARGLMQLRPGTARDMARGDARLAGGERLLDQPRMNLAFGQLYLQQLRDSEATQGLLPKVMAAYNAGPLPVGRWNSQIHDRGDPLLWMESIPYWETRGYVSAVMRNYWMYEKQAGGPSESRLGLAQGLWPKFPGLAGAPSVRVAYNDAASGD